MTVSGSAAALAFAFLVAGCASQVPHPKYFSSTDQLVPKSAQHWQTIADDVAVQTKGALGDLKGKPIHVARSGKGTSFNAAFRDFLVTRLVAHGLPASRRPEGALLLEYSTQLVNHRTEGILELIVTTWITDNGRYVARKSDVYYVDHADARLFVERRRAATREYRVVGSGQ